MSPVSPHATVVQPSRFKRPPPLPTVLPGAQLREVVCLGKAFDLLRDTSCCAPDTKKGTQDETVDHVTAPYPVQAYVKHRCTLVQPHVVIHSFISFHFISFHFISFHFISFHFISFHFISFHFISFHFISFHFISFHFISFHFISFHFISFHFISFHFISFHFISFHFISFHFISFHSFRQCTARKQSARATHDDVTHDVYLKLFKTFVAPGPSHSEAFTHAVVRPRPLCFLYRLPRSRPWKCFSSSRTRVLRSFTLGDEPLSLAT